MGQRTPRESDSETQPRESRSQKISRSQNSQIFDVSVRRRAPRDLLEIPKVKASEAHVHNSKSTWPIDLKLGGVKDSLLMKRHVDS